MARWWALFLSVLVVGLSPMEAHQELYHNIEVDLRGTADSGTLNFTFTIHAPELLVGFSEAAKAMYDSRWLAKQSDEDLEGLVGLARQYLGKRFELRLDGAEAVNFESRLAFEEFERMRGGGKRGLPPACIEAGMELLLPKGARRLQLQHAADSGKRLMLVLYRPKTFPAVIDVEPGSSATVDLVKELAVTETPVDRKASDERKGRGSAISAGIVLASLVVIGFVLARWLRFIRPRRSGS